MYDFFNPKTNGAKIAGRAPDQVQVGEVARKRIGAEMQLDAAAGERGAVEAFNRWLLEWEAAEAENDRAVAQEPQLVGSVDAAALGAELARREGGQNVGSDVAEDAEDAMALELAQRYEQFDTQAKPLCGQELALLCKRKYGKYHDIAIKAVRMTEGSRRWVSLNIYVGHLGQRSNPETPEGYLERMESLAVTLNRWNQAGFVRTFFREKPIARRGLPSHPRVDTAVALRLNRSPTWDDELVKDDAFFEFF